MRIFVDIDGTICKTLKDDGAWDYRNSKPIHTNIEKINKLKADGNEIVYWTARGSTSGIDWHDFTHNQLMLWGCLFDDLICGKKKGAFDMIIDDKAKRIEEI